MTAFESQILHTMLNRQHLSNKAVTEAEYETLFRALQPVPPIFFTCPGESPRLVHRVEFDDREHNNDLRSRRTIVKGRFQGGTVGYVYRDELELYIAAYRKNEPVPDYTTERLYTLLREEGPLNIHQMMELSGLKAKAITPILHKLAQAFLVFEDQCDFEWDRGFYVFEQELSEVDCRRFERDDAIVEILTRAIRMGVFCTAQGLKSFTRLPARDIKQALSTLLEGERIAAAEAFGKTGYLLREDYAALSALGETLIPACVFVLHRSDFLVRLQEAELKAAFAGREVLQYILVDGQFAGAVCGHWRQGPHDVDDIALTLDQREAETRKDEIIAAVAELYSPPFSTILKYNGKLL